MTLLILHSSEHVDRNKRQTEFDKVAEFDAAIAPLPPARLFC